jgi:hypothetical protein
MMDVFDLTIGSVGSIFIYRYHCSSPRGVRLTVIPARLCAPSHHPQILLSAKAHVCGFSVATRAVRSLGASLCAADQAAARWLRAPRAVHLTNATPVVQGVPERDSIGGMTLDSHGASRPEVDASCGGNCRWPR